jgi:6-phospho-beta-glucosidase
LKIALIGGGGFRAPMVYAGLLRREQPAAEVVLDDVDDDRLRRIEAVMAGMAQERGHRIPTRRTTSLEDAIEGADFVLCAIRVGGMAGRARDERLAQDAGLLGQETVGAAGILYALRTIPVMQELARLVARRAPRAWFLNFTNPAGVVTEALHAILGDRAIGICDSPSALCDRVAHALGRPPRSLRFGYSGLNHLGWLTAVHDDNDDADLLPSLLAAPERLDGAEERRLFGDDWLQATGAIPNEYLFYFQRTRAAIDTVEATGRTRGETIVEQQRAFYEAPPAATPAEALRRWRAVRGERERTYLQEAGDAVHAVPGTDEGGYAEVALQAMDALLGDTPRTVIANVANGATLPYLPDDAVVEVPTLLSRAGVRPLPQPPLPPHAKGLVETVKEVERAVLDAATTGSRPALLRALALHPLGGGLDTARRIAARAPEGARTNA